MEQRMKVYDYVKWGNKVTNEASKKIVLNAVNYNAELVCQVSEPGQDKVKFADVCKVPIEQSAFGHVAESLFKYAANEIQRKSYKARESNTDTLLVDSAFVSQDFHVLRVRSFVKIKDGSSSRITKIMVHKLNGWDDIKAANKAAAEMKNGSLGFTKDTCIFEIVLPPFSVIQGNWRDAIDTATLNELGKKLSTMFDKPTSYGDFLTRVYESNNNGGASIPSEGGTTSVGKTATVDFDDDECPF